MFKLKKLTTAPVIVGAVAVAALTLVAVEHRTRNSAEEVLRYTINSEDEQEPEVTIDVELPGPLTRSITSLVNSIPEPNFSGETIANVLDTPPFNQSDEWRIYSFAGRVLAEKNRYQEALTVLDLLTQEQRDQFGSSFSYAVALRELDRNEGAIAAYRAYINYNPNHQASHINMAIILADLGRHDEAIAELEASKNIYSGARKGKVYSLLGISYLEVGNYAAAEEHFVKSIDFRPTNGPTWRRLAEVRALMADIDPDVVEETFRRADAISPGSAPIQESWASYYLSKARFDAALEPFRSAATYAPGDVNIAIMRTINLLASERPRAAGRNFDDIRKSDVSSDGELAYRMLDAFLTMDAEELQAEMTEWPEATEQDVENYLWSLALLEVGDFDKAREKANLIPANSVLYQTAQFTLARAAVKAENFAEAVTLLTPLIDQNDLSPFFYRYRGRAHMGLDETYAALSDFTRAQELYPDSRRSTLDLTEALLLTEQFDVAETVLQDYLDDKPRDASVLEVLGDLYVRQGDYKSARDVFSEAIDLDEGNLAVSLKLAKSQFASEAEVAAIKTLRDLIEASPAEIEPRLVLIEVFRSLDREEEAQEEYEKVMKLDPERESKNDADGESKGNLEDEYSEDGTTKSAALEVNSNEDM